jgi:hypothetical protein
MLAEPLDDGGGEARLIALIAGQDQRGVAACSSASAVVASAV